MFRFSTSICGPNVSHRAKHEMLQLERDAYEALPKSAERLLTELKYVYTIKNKRPNSRPSMTLRPILMTLTALSIGGCSVADVTAPDLAALKEPALQHRQEKGPPGAPAGTCWGKTVSPAVIETVTEQIVVQPAEILADGTVVSPAIYKTETLQQIVKERRETWFQTPCPDVLTEEFVESLQRALKARGHFRGGISGEMDARTRAAIRRYQTPQGLDSGILALETGRQLGLVAVERDVQ